VLRSLGTISTRDMSLLSDVDRLRNEMLDEQLLDEAKRRLEEKNY
jgi:hypothetical protein